MLEQSKAAGKTSKFKARDLFQSQDLKGILYILIYFLTHNWNWGLLTQSKLNLDEIFDSQILGSEYILWYKGFFIHV